MARAEASAAIALRIVGSTTDVTADLKRVAQPTLVLHGEIDRIVPLESARTLAATLPDSELQILDGCGHVPTLSRPKAVAEAMRAFLRRRQA